MPVEKCDFCGRQINSKQIVYQDKKLICPNCHALNGTCHLCSNQQSCEFQTNSDPMPKQVMKTVRQNNMLFQQQVINPERVKRFCESCACFSMADYQCNKQTSQTCGNYNYIFNEKENLSEN